MADINWDDLPDAPEEKNQIDWDSLPSADVSNVKSAALGLGQGASLGFGDELAGQLGARVIDPIAAKLKPGYQPDTPEQATQFARQQHAASNKEDPWLYGGAELIGGAAATAPFGGPLNALGKGASGIAKGMGAGRVLSSAASGAAQGAPIGAVYGLGSSESDSALGMAADTATGGLGGAITGGVLSGGIEGIKIGASKIGEIGRRLKAYADDLLSPSIGKQSTGGIEKKIEKQARFLDRSQAAPEAATLRDLASDVGTESGVAKRQAALMSPLSREQKNAQFFEETKNFYNTVQENFSNFEKNIRFNEAANNLKGVSADNAKKEISKQIVQADVLIHDMGKKAEQKMYDKSAVGYLKLYTDELYRDLKKSADSYDVYVAVNEAKKKIAGLGGYGKDVGPMERETVKRIKIVESGLTDILENENIFGQQAARHKQINQSYNKFLTNLENMKNAFTKAEASEFGRPIDELSSTSIGTYSRQLDTIHGADRRRFLDSMIQGAEDLSRTIDDSAANLKLPRNEAQSSKDLITNYLKSKGQFAEEMTRSNQLRRMRWDSMVSEGAKPSGGQQVAEMAVNAKIPGFSALKNIATSSLNEQEQTNQLIRQLLNKETQPSVTDKVTATGINKIGSALQSAPQIFGKFAAPLQSASAKSPAAFAVTNFLLHQQNPEYQQISSQIQNNNEGEN